jgi:hypothetical protein
MTMTMTSVPERTNSSIRPLANMLKRLRIGMLEKFQNSSEVSCRTKEAIEILGSRNASPDMREWAERYLCGFAQADKAQFFESRQWQS